MEDSLKALRKAHEGEEAIKVYDAFRSHAAITRKNRLLLTLLDDIRQANAEVGGTEWERVKRGEATGCRDGWMDGWMDGWVRVLARTLRACIFLSTED